MGELKNYGQDLAQMTNGQLMEKSKQDLSGNWGEGVGATFIFFAIIGTASLIPGASLFLSGAFTLGFSIWALKISRGEMSEVGNLFDGFKQYVNSLVAYLLSAIAVSIGLLLLIVPGVILALGLSQVYFIMADDKEISGVDALQKSWEMMKGHKGDYFVLMLMFFGLGILSVFTLFIGLLWLIPFMYVTTANFHRKITNDDSGEESDGITEHLIEDFV